MDNEIYELRTMKTEQEYHEEQHKLLQELSDINRKIRPLQIRAEEITGKINDNENEFMKRILVDWTQTEHALPPRQA
jgi:predicted  nucleic acid-binding Zn-ribbon protein